MMNKLNSFIAFFKGTTHWATMVATIENSPWHREANVSVHTEMCLEQYMARFAPHRAERQNLIAILALLFHDTGKPEAEETLEKKDGSGEMYRRYAGHEPISAVAFTECYMTMPELRALITAKEARAIRWCIEHHLPYGMKNKEKRQGLRNGTRLVFDEIGLNDDTYFDVLRSDAAGRISDDHDVKLANVEDWINGFQTVEFRHEAVQSVNTMYILVGPSGSGKSTWIRKLIAELEGYPTVTISQDDQKDVFFSMMFPDVVFRDSVQRYENVWQYCTMAPESSAAYRKFFEAQVKAMMEKAKATKAHVFIDIVNASKKKRQMWVDQAKRAGMRVVAVEFWNAFETLVARQSTRGDKHVPRSSIKQQVSATSCCWLGHEVDQVIMEIGK